MKAGIRLIIQSHYLKPCRLLKEDWQYYKCLLLQGKNSRNRIEEARIAHTVEC